MRIPFLILLFCLLADPARAVLVVDGFRSGTLTNALGGAWISYDDGSSTIALDPTRSPGHGQAPHAMGVDYQLNAGPPYPFVGAICFLNPSYAPADISGHIGVRFWCRGQGGWQLFVATRATNDAKNHYAAPFRAGEAWSLVELPFSALAQSWGPAGAWDPGHALSLGFGSVGRAGAKGRLELGDLEFYDQGEALAKPYAPFTSPRPKVNQVGYLSADSKWFSVISQTAGAAAPFAIVDASGNTAYQGTLGSERFDDTALSGEWVLRGNFSGLEKEGTYRVRIQGQESQPFRVGPAVYDGLWKDALRCFYLIRCGTAIHDSVTGIDHAACHLVRHTDSDPSLDRDFSGGWHNAGDFGRWAHEEAFAVSHMLWLAEWRPDLAAHPPAGDPGLLNEARWGLAWLFKMQNPDGSVLHKVDSEPDFAAGRSPDADPTTSLARYAGRYSTIDAAVFSAVVAQAARVFQASDPAYAAKCAAASAKSWAWAQAHPNLGQDDPYYTDAVVWQKTLWAECERFRLTREPALEADLAGRLAEHPLTYEAWNDPQLLGYFTLAFDEGPGASPTLSAQAVEAITAYADRLEAEQNASGYCVWVPAGRYYWGSISEVIGAGNVFCAAALLNRENRFRQDALRAMDNILGVNALEHSHAALYGSRSNHFSYHWAFLSAGKLMPGWLSEGPNSDPHGADPGLVALIQRGTPPTKCFLDDGMSWATNEGTTDIESAFLLLCGYFHSPAGIGR